MEVFKEKKCDCLPDCKKVISKVDHWVRDVCKTKTTDGYHNWSDDWYEVDESRIAKTVRLERNKGTSYPEGSSGEYLDLHICCDCFDRHILANLESLGVQLRWKEYDY